MCDINIVKFLAANIIGTLFIALLGFLMGSLLAWLAGFFVPDGYKPYIVLIVFVGFMLGVPRIWVSNWRQLKAHEFIAEALSDYSNLDNLEEPASRAPKRSLQTTVSDSSRSTNRNGGLTFRNNVRGTVADYIVQNDFDPATGLPLPDILVTRIGTAIYWPKISDPSSGEAIPQWVGFEPRIGDAVHAWWDNGQFYCEQIPKTGKHARV